MPDPNLIPHKEVSATLDPRTATALHIDSEIGIKFDLNQSYGTGPLKLRDKILSLMSNSNFVGLVFERTSNDIILSSLTYDNSGNVFNDTPVQDFDQYREDISFRPNKEQTKVSIAQDQLLNKMFLDTSNIPELVFFPKYSLYPLFNREESSSIIISGVSINYNKWAIDNTDVPITDSSLLCVSLKIETELGNLPPNGSQSNTTPTNPNSIPPPIVVVGEPCPPIWPPNGQISITE
ncbi:MAG: hypothetical protein AAFP82_09305, partial [Bacteroidota bacterium]